MTQIEWSGYLNNREYSEVLSKEEAKEAKKDGIVIVWFPDKNTLCFKGAIEEEISCKNGFNVDRVRLTHKRYEELVITVYASDEFCIASGQFCESFNVKCDGEIVGMGTVLKLKRR
jgi:hypothetical protein